MEIDITSLFEPHPRSLRLVKNSWDRNILLDTEEKLAAMRDFASRHPFHKKYIHCYDEYEVNAILIEWIHEDIKQMTSTSTMWDDIELWQAEESIPINIYRDNGKIYFILE